MQGHTFGITSMAFAPDNKSLATASGHWEKAEGAEAIVWDLASEEPRQTLKGHQHGLWCVRYAPDGRSLVTASHDGTMRLWELATAQERLRLSVEELLKAPTAKPAAISLSDAELNALWADLASREAPKAFRAIGVLCQAPESSVVFLRTHLPPAPLLNEELQKHINQLIAALDHDDFQAREKATAELEKLGTTAETALRKALADSSSAEVRQRAEALVAKLQAKSADPERWRTIRALEALERIATPQAKELIISLSKGAPGASLTQDADAASKRLAQRNGVQP